MTMSARHPAGNAFVQDAAQSIPRMVNDEDVALVEQCASTLQSNDTALEFGPWLGALSVVLARKAQLHVVDVFKWTKAHAKKVPDLLVPGDSFRPLHKQILAARGLSATQHESDFANFAWHGGAIALCLIDGPKTAEALKDCLRAVLPHLVDGAPVLLKNGLNPQYTGMATYIEALLDADVLSLSPQGIGRKCNTIVLAPGPTAEDLAQVGVGTSSGDASSIPLGTRAALASNHPAHLGPLVRYVENGDYPSAYAYLSTMPPARELTRAWDKNEPALLKHRADDGQLATLSEIIAVHHGAVPRDEPESFTKSPARALRAYWLNNADNPWRGEGFQPDIILRTLELGYLSFPNKIRSVVHGKDILDVGCGPGLHGIGYLVAGARSYAGIDPIIKRDRDRVKDLIGKTKTKFGLTPDEIEARIPAWHVEATPIADTDPTARFDLATLHNVTEHLHDLEGVFGEIAIRLRDGGRFLYNHHNFYTWNGHHLPPKTVKDIDLNDPSQRQMVDWGHVEYEPEPEHYIARGLNRIRLDEIIEITRKYFDIEILEEVQAREETGLNRLTDPIRARHPYLSDRDFLTQNLFCIARKRG